MLRVQNPLEVAEEVLAVVQVVPELGVRKRDAAAELRFLKSERTNTIFAGSSSERGVCGCNSLFNCCVVGCKVGG